MVSLSDQRRTQLFGLLRKSSTAVNITSPHLSSYTHGWRSLAPMAQHRDPGPSSTTTQRYYIIITTADSQRLQHEEAQVLQPGMPSLSLQQRAPDSRLNMLSLRRLLGGFFTALSANTGMNGFWGGRCEKTFVDVRVFNPYALTQQSPHTIKELERWNMHATGGLIEVLSYSQTRLSSYFSNSRAITTPQIDYI